MKKLINTALVYLIAGAAAGVFFREFTNFAQFTGQTTLGLMHPHLLVLGFAVFLIATLFALDLKGLIDLQKFGLGIRLNTQRAEQIGAAGVGRGAAHRCRQQGTEQQQGREQAGERHEVSPLSQSR